MAINRLIQGSLQSGLPKFDSVWDGRSAVGSMEPISAITLTGSQSSVEFNNIPGTYSHLQLRWFAQTNRSTYGFEDLRVNFNNDSSALYTYHELWGDGSSALTAAAADFNYILLFNTAGTQISGNWWASAIVDILDYANTSKNKTIRTFNGIDLNGNAIGSPTALNGRVNLASGLWRSTSAITTITLSTNNSSSFQQYSSFSLYGIK